MSSKPRIIKNFEKLSTEIQEQIKLAFPYGFDKYLITFKNIENKFVSALPFETEDKYYLVRMTKAQANQIVEDDDDFDVDGNLKKDVQSRLTKKFHDEIDEIDDLDDELIDESDDDNDDNEDD